MNNYPPGAANDPNAPYNQEDPPEIDVTVKQLLVKETCILSYGGHEEVDSEYDPTEGRYVHSQYWEPGNVEEDFREQCRTAAGCLADCCRWEVERYFENTDSLDEVKQKMILEEGKFHDD